MFVRFRSENHYMRDTNLFWCILIVYAIGETDLEAFEAFMTGKKFLMGDKVCNEDAAVFGQLCQGMYHTRGPIHDYLVGKKRISCLLFCRLAQINLFYINARKMSKSKSIYWTHERVILARLERKYPREKLTFKVLFRDDKTQQLW